MDQATALQVAGLLGRIAAALERLAPPAPAEPDFAGAMMFRCDATGTGFAAAPDFPLPLDLLLGVETQKATLVATLGRFASGLPANNVLLWGARGAGKSSLVKAAVTAVASEAPALRLVEVEREVVNILPKVFATLRNRPERFVILFEEGAGAAKSMKSALEGGVLGPPQNVLFVATSNRRHLMPRSREAAERLAAEEDAQETISASDRFGLWLGFPPMDQPTYLAAVRAYAAHFGLQAPDVERRALQWAQLRGGRSGRTAWQFTRELAGEQGRVLPL